MMHTPILAFMAIVLSSPSLRAQHRPELGSYDIRRAAKVIESALLRGRTWESPSDDDGYSFFYSRRDFKGSHKLVVVPVFRGESGDDSTILYALDYSYYVAFLFRDSTFIEVVNVSQINRGRGKPLMIFGEGTGNIKLYVTAGDRSTLFYNSTINRFCIIKSGKEFCWDDEASSFVELLF
jgi:hypothetical protein